MVPLAMVWIGFAAGSIPWGVLIAKRLGVEIRERGSGNIGATNVARVIGIGPGVLVLVLDALKGALPVLAARHWLGVPEITALTGFAAIAGHCFSPLLRGKGGKGVATALGVFTVVSPPMALVAVGVWLFVAGRTRVPALGSLAGVAAANLFAVFTGAPESIRMLALAVMLLLVYTHRGNLAGLTRPR